MNTVPTTTTNPANSQNNHSACAGERGLGAMPSNKQNAKGATFALLANISCKKIRYSPTRAWLEKDGRTLLFGKRKSH